MNTNRATTQLDPVENHVVGVCQHRARGLIQLFHVVRPRRRKGVVQRLPTLAPFIVFHQREVDHPEKIKALGISEPPELSHVTTQVAEHVADHPVAVGTKKNQVSVGRLATLGERLFLCVREELHHR